MLRFARFVLLLGSLIAMPAHAQSTHIVAHRGASHDAPENTLAALKLAWEQRADAIECDIRFTSDRRVVIMHDADAERITGCKAKVADLTYEQIRQLDAGSWKAAKWKDEKVPTLEEVLAVVPLGKHILIEIKIGPEIVPEMKELIEASAVRSEQITIISFSEKSLMAARKAMPRIRMAWLHAFAKKDGTWTITTDELLRRAKASGADDVSLAFSRESAEVINADLAAKLKSAGFGLQVWTVDDVDLARRAMALGASAITTNRPGWLREELAGRR